MIFSSSLFIFVFLPIVLLLYYLIPQKLLKVKNGLLLVASLVFYSWGEPLVVFVMLLSITANYIFGIFVGKNNDAKNKSGAKLWLVLTLVFNIGLFFVFKYLNFFLENLNLIINTDVHTSITLPIGISFFTFQILSYVLDVYWGKVKVQYNLFNLALYISFFPQLIAGPIVRYIDIETQLNCRNHDVTKFSEGVQRFIIGFSKKIIIANQVSVYADMAFRNNNLYDNLAAPMAWIGAICYAIQIYFDFSGYSDMAIGLGKMFGFEFLENFNHPYMSRSVQDFWRRWHISLSSWFRDYLYIPLGGNRKGNLRTYINLVIVFFVTGLWHGASWSFIVWGLYHGFFLVMERLWLGKVLKKIPTFFTWLYTIITVIIGWVIFRADNLGEAIKYIRSMFNFSENGLQIALANMNIFVVTTLIFGMILSLPIVPYIKNKLYGEDTFFTKLNVSLKSEIVGYLSIFGCCFLFLFSIVILAGSDFNPFLYFRF